MLQSIAIVYNTHLETKTGYLYP